MLKHGKSTVAIGLAACWLATTALAAEPAIIPQPQNTERRQRAFKLTPDLVIATDAASKDTGKFLAERLRLATGCRFKTTARKGPDQTLRGSAIILTTENARADLGAEDYELEVAPGVVTISAATQAGVFYGAQTLLQLLPPEIFSAEALKNFDWEIPCVRISDETRLVRLGVDYRNSALGDGTGAQNQESTPQLSPATMATPVMTPGDIRIDAWNASPFTDSSGNVWQAQLEFIGGDVAERDLALKIANIKGPGLLLTEHYAMDAFVCNLPNGRCLAKLDFAEAYEGITGPGERVFSLNVQGREFKDIDVWVKAGGPNRAYIETVPVEVTDGKFKITFTSNIENPQINAIEIIPKS